LLARGGLPHKGKYLAWRSFEGGARWSRIFNCPLSRSAGIDYKWTGRIEVMGTPRPKELAVEGTWSVLQRIRPHTNHGVRVQGKKTGIPVTMRDVLNDATSFVPRDPKQVIAYLQNQGFRGEIDEEMQMQIRDHLQNKKRSLKRALGIDVSLIRPSLGCKPSR